MADISIYTDPSNMDKANVQLCIWNGTKWVELSNGKTINTINANISSIADKVKEAQEGIAQAKQDAQNAVDTAKTYSYKVDNLQIKVDGKVDSQTYQSDYTQLSSDINLRVKTGDLLSQINIESGNTLIQSNKIYLDASSVVFGGTAFIPSANIASISADKISTGTMTAGAINLGNGTFKVDTSGNLTATSAKITGGTISINDTFSVDSTGAMKVTDSANQGVYFNMSQMALKTGLTSGGTLFDVAGNISSYDSIPEDLIVTNETAITSLSFPNSTTSLSSEYYSKFGIIINDGNGNTSNMSTTGISMVSTKSTNVSAGTELDLTAKTNINISSTSGSLAVNSNKSMQFSTASGDLILTAKNGDAILGNGDGTGNVGVRGNIFYWDLKENGTRMIYADNNNFNILSGGFSATAAGSHIRNTQIDNELWVNGKLEASSLTVSGSKNAIVQTSKGWAKINAYETAEYYFGDIGKTNTGLSSRVKVAMDSLFLETVNTKIDYHVFVSAYGNGYAWVSDMTEDSFIINSSVPNLEISYEVKAKRVEYEGDRLEIDPDYTDHSNVGISKINSINQ